MDRTSFRLVLRAIIFYPVDFNIWLSSYEEFVEIYKNKKTRTHFKLSILVLHGELFFHE